MSQDSSPLEQLVADNPAQPQSQSSTPDFDINAYEAGKPSPLEALVGDFNINDWENGRKPSATSVEGRPQVQPPKLDMQEDRGTMPGGKLQGLPGTDFSRTPTTKEALGDVALASAPIGAAMAGAAELPAAARTVYAASKAHPVMTALAYHVARELGIPLPKVLDVLDRFGGK